MTPFISLENTALRKFEKIVVRNLTWQIEDQQHWAIVGENGSGKTTLLEALAGKIPFVGGKVKFHFLEEGQLLKDKIELVSRDYSGNRILNSAAQYYQQRFNVYDAENSPTVREFLTDQMKPIGTIDEKSVQLPPSPYTEEELMNAAKVLRIEHLLERKLMTLSNGETRRTLLTRSFLKRPKVMLLDTPFVGLDVASRAILHEAINAISQHGTHIILVTTPDEIPTCITNVFELKKSTETENTQEVNLDHDLLEELLASSTSQDNFEYAVSMRNVNVSYGNKKVLNTLNWEVKRGEKWAVLGPNGSGKSTLLSLINADNPQSYANDFDLFDRKRGSGESIWDIKGKIGFVSPELHLFFTKRTEVFKAVASGLYNTNGLYQALKPGQQELAEKYLRLLGIEHLSQKRFSEISTGEQRMVLLARALIKNPPLLVLDEPCQGLDQQHIRYFRDLVDEICVKLNKTLLYVTHYEGEIPACVSKVLKMTEGNAEILDR
ncbi:ATP-binding cassette domain-containing protein [Flectobacillus roseus]|uniref:ATP-binding cassette domain-containing protein n=1 Tax=Flectobacillus roseus TaxID=502259 RepID=UPI0024B82622|nr:ATP-binding cassette domain-containing protein [Flectobacillus roseus]MDI9868647.1 ATP-binding cassette domain-containing protein [Flectobacillus roseus]